MALLTMALATYADAQERSVELPAFDPGALEAAVAEQLGSLREHTEALLGRDANIAGIAEAVGELGRHYLAYELVEPAEKCFREADRLAPRDFRWKYHLGYVLQKGGRLEEAASEYERALGVLPDVAPALIRLGEVYKALNRPEAAEDVVRKALALDPVSAAAEALLGEIYLSRQQYPEAISLLSAALDKTPEANRLYYPLGLAYRGLGEEDKAREMIARRGSVGIKPGDPLIDRLPELTTGERVHILRGRSAFAAGRFEEAVEEFRRAVEAQPESIPGFINLGSALAEVGRVDEAIESFRRAVELGEGNVTARLNLGILLARQERFEEAAAELRQAVQYGPGDGEAHFELAEALRRLGRLEDSLTHYALAVELAPPAELARLSQAQALIELGRLGEAHKRLEEGLAAVPTSGLLSYGLARFLASSPDPSLRDGERALDLARRVHAARPDTSAALLVAEALSEVGDCAAAAEWIREVLSPLEASLEEAGAGPSGRVQALRERLARYEGGTPCRPPAAAAAAEAGPES